MRIAIKEVGKPLQIVETAQQYRDNAVKPYTGQDELVEYVRLSPDGCLCLGVNEIGLRLDLPTNFLIHVSNPRYPIQKMLGNVVFIRHKPVNIFEEEIWDYEVTDLNEEDLQFIEYLLSPEVQNTLAEEFVDYGMNAPVYAKTFTPEELEDALLSGLL